MKTIPAEILPHIFERSYRGDKSGLAIAKSIVELRGGTILAESDKTGIEFIINLPTLKGA